mgnify:CR=1 FL=1
MHTTPPLSLEPLRFRMPAVEHRLLSNGTAVHVICSPTQDLFSITVAMRTGAIHDEVPGNTSLAAQMLTRGTTTRTAAEFALDVESRGCTIRSSADSETTTIRSSGLAEWFSDILGLIGGAIRSPRFDERELHTLRSQILADIQIDCTDVEWLALRACSQANYGNHPYGRPRNGTPVSLQSITPEVLQSAHERMLHAERHVIIAGPFRLEDVYAQLEDTFGALPVARSLSGAPRAQPRYGAGVIAPKEDAVQTAFRIAMPCPPYLHADDVQVQLLTSILGGHSLARLFSVLREEKGYTYGAYAFNDVRPHGAVTGIVTSVGNEFTADTMNTIATVLDEFAQEQITDEEFDTSRQHVLGSFARSNETPQQTAGLVWATILHGLPATYFTDLVAAMQQLTPFDVGDAQRTWFNRERWIVGMAGKEDVLRKAITPFVSTVETWDNTFYR